jgi:hypothetical protein
MFLTQVLCVLFELLAELSSQSMSLSLPESGTVYIS